MGVHGFVMSQETAIMRRHASSSDIDVHYPTQEVVLFVN